MPHSGPALASLARIAEPPSLRPRVSAAPLYPHRAARDSARERAIVRRLNHGQRRRADTRQRDRHCAAHFIAQLRMHRRERETEAPRENPTMTIGVESGKWRWRLPCVNSCCSPCAARAVLTRPSVLGMSRKASGAMNPVRFSSSTLLDVAVCANAGRASLRINMCSRVERTDVERKMMPERPGGVAIRSLL